MKPIVTCIVLANARTVRTHLNFGPSRGLSPNSPRTWHANPTEKPSSAAGSGHSIAGPAVTAVEQADPIRKAEEELARQVALDLSHDIQDHKFDRLVVVAGPRMLGLLRASFDKVTQSALVGEIPKDLSMQPLDKVVDQVGEVVAV